jgi:ATP-binding cassette subfamily B protein
MAAFSAAGMLLGGISSYLYTRGSSRILIAMRCALFDRLERAEMGFFSRIRVGEIVARLNNDMVEIQGVLVDIPLAFVVNSARLAAASAVLVAMSWRLFLIGNVLVPLGVLGMWLTRHVITGMSRELREKNASLGSFIIDIFSGIRLVRSSGTEGDELHRFERENLSLLRSVLRFQMVSSLSRGIPSFVLACSAMLAFLYGGYMIRDGAMTVGTLVAFTAFQVQVVAPIQNLLGQYVALRKGRASLTRVFEFFDVPVEGDDGGTAAFTAPKEGIAFDNVSFSYGGRARVLDGLSLFVPAGMTTAIVGESGAGKSTLIDLFLRFHEPESGEIRIDGVPLRRMGRSSLRGRVTVVSTEPFLFHGTIGENVGYGCPAAAAADIEEAAARADLGEFIASLPDGLSTVVGERGMVLSAGQKQRVALARAFLRSPDILVLDEATSSLDVLTEDRVRSSVRELMKGRTTIIVTHRLHTVRDADWIAVMDNGRIARRGTHEELAGSRGPYRAFLTVCGGASVPGKEAPNA